MFINSNYIALYKKDQQVPIRPNLFKVQVYNLTFGAYLVEPIVFWLLQSLEKFVVKLRKILVLGHLLKNMLNLFHYKIVFKKNYLWVNLPVESPQGNARIFLNFGAKFRAFKFRF